MEEKNKGGRPTLYDPEFHPKDLIERMATGMVDVEIYADWGICKDTFLDWRRVHPELKEAYQIGLSKWRKCWYQKGREFMERGNRDAYKYWAHMLGLKGDKEDKEEKQGTNLTINTLNQLNVQDKSEAELTKILDDKLARLRLVGFGDSKEARVFEAEKIEIKPNDPTSE